MTQRDPFAIADKNVLVTGGTAGIGLGVARHFVETGARVVITGRRKSGDDIADEIGAHFVAMDVADPGSVTRGMALAAKRLNGEIQVLILNAGVGLSAGPIDELDLDTFKQTFSVNVFGVVQGLRDGLRYMQEGASVIITSSPAGTIFVPGNVGYNASKAAVNALTQTCALELGPKGIRVNAVIPGMVETELSLNPDDNEAETEVVRTMTATGRVRQPAEMGPIFQFLASDASAPMTGSLVACDDGLTAGFSVELLEKAFGGAEP